MNKNLLVALIIAGSFLKTDAVGLAQPPGETDETEDMIALLRRDVRSERKQLVAMNLPLTDDEAIRFWPLFDRYAADLSKVFDTRIGLVREYAAAYPNVPEELAASLTKRSIEAEQAVTELRLKYLPQFQQVLPGRKTAIFFQLDRRLGLLIEIQLASEIPIVIP